MRKLKLPVISELPEKRKWLSMDEYVEFVNFNLRHFRRSKIAKRDEMAMRVSTPFVIK